MQLPPYPDLVMVMLSHGSRLKDASSEASGSLLFNVFVLKPRDRAGWRQSIRRLSRVQTKCPTCSLRMARLPALHPGEPRARGLAMLVRPGPARSP
jgi:hypothetical protein